MRPRTPTTIKMRPILLMLKPWLFWTLTAKSMTAPTAIRKMLVPAPMGHPSLSCGFRLCMTADRGVLRTFLTPRRVLNALGPVTVHAPQSVNDARIGRQGVVELAFGSVVDVGCVRAPVVVEVAPFVLVDVVELSFRLVVVGWPVGVVTVVVDC